MQLTLSVKYSDFYFFKNILQVHDLSTGKLLKTLPLEMGTITGYSGKEKYPEIFYQFTSFLSPGIIYRCDLSTNEFLPSVSTFQKLFIIIIYTLLSDKLTTFKGRYFWVCAPDSSSRPQAGSSEVVMDKCYECNFGILLNVTLFNLTSVSSYVLMATKQKWIISTSSSLSHCLSPFREDKI